MTETESLSRLQTQTSVGVGGIDRHGRDLRVLRGCGEGHGASERRCREQFDHGCLGWSQRVEVRERERERESEPLGAWGRAPGRHGITAGPPEPKAVLGARTARSKHTVGACDPIPYRVRHVRP